MPRSRQRTVDLSREPLVFCFSDIFYGNFIVDDDDQMVVVDFAAVSILPASFALFIAYDERHGHAGIPEMVSIPGSSLENVKGLGVLAGLLTIGAGFGKMGKRTSGGDEITQERLKSYIITNS